MRGRWMRLVAGALALSGCATTALPPQAIVLPATAHVAVLPFANPTEVPQAGRRVQAIVVALLHQKGLREVLVYPQKPVDNPLEAEPTVSLAEALDWARQQRADYALSGTVTEWRYKTGIDAEPALGLTLQLIEVPSGATLWSASGGRSGWGFQGLAAVAQKQVQALLRGIQIESVPKAP